MPNFALAAAVESPHARATRPTQERRADELCKAGEEAALAPPAESFYVRARNIEVSGLKVSSQAGEARTPIGVWFECNVIT